LAGTFGEAAFLAGRGDRASSAVAISRARLLVFSREWTSSAGIGGRMEEGEEEEEACKKYKTMCDGIWALLPTLVSSPVSR
jgi:hypothetical protein